MLNKRRKTLREKSWISSGKESLGELTMRTGKINRPKEVGVYYKATVPDTMGGHQPVS